MHGGDVPPDTSLPLTPEDTQPSPTGVLLHRAAECHTTTYTRVCVPSALTARLAASPEHLVGWAVGAGRAVRAPAPLL